MDIVKIKGKLNQDCRFNGNIYVIGTIVIIDNFTTFNENDFATCIMPDNRLLSISIKAIEFMEYFKIPIQ